MKPFLDRRRCALLDWFLESHWAVALLVAVACALLGTVAQWVYGRWGLDLEGHLLARLQPRAPRLSLSNALTATVVLVVLGIPASSVILQGVLRLLGVATRPMGVTYRLTAFTSVLAVVPIRVNLDGQPATG